MSFGEAAGLIEISTFFMLYGEDDQSKLKSVPMTEVAK